MAEAGCPFCIENGKVNPFFVRDRSFIVEPLNSPLDNCYLIVPSTHVSRPDEIPDADLVSMHKSLQFLEESGYILTDYNLVFNVGPYAGQRVDHVHQWVVPRSPLIENDTARNLGLATILSRLHA